MSQMKGQDKTPEKSSKWSKPSRKRIQNKDGEDDWGSWKNNEDARNVYQRSRGTKEQTEMNNTLEENNKRIVETEEWINDLEEGQWKSQTQDRIQKKKWIVMKMA